MISNAVEADVAIESLRTFTKALDLLRLDLKETNPSLFPIVSQTYIRRIRDLQEEILDYYAALCVGYNRSEATLAETVREPTTEYAGHFVADNSTGVTEQAPENDERDAHRAEISLARSEGIEFGIRAGKADIIAMLINIKFASISRIYLERISALGSHQLDQLAEQVPGFASADALEAWLNQISEQAS